MAPPALRYYEGCTEAEVADQLGISAGTVKSHARDGLARLRTVLPAADDHEGQGSGEHPSRLGARR